MWQWKRCASHTPPWCSAWAEPPVGWRHQTGRMLTSHPRNKEKHRDTRLAEYSLDYLYWGFLFCYFGGAVALFRLIHHLFELGIGDASRKHQSATRHLNLGTIWVDRLSQLLTHTHTHSNMHTEIESNKFLAEEIYGWGPQNNSIKTRLDWCSTDQAAELCGHGSEEQGLHSLQVAHIHSIKPDWESFAI